MLKLDLIMFGGRGATSKDISTIRRELKNARISMNARFDAYQRNKTKENYNKYIEAQDKVRSLTQEEDKAKNKRYQQALNNPGIITGLKRNR